MMSQPPPQTPAEHIERAKTHLANGSESGYAIAHALVAIAELMAVNQADVIMDATSRGVVAGMQATSSILEYFPGFAK